MSLAPFTMHWKFSLLCAIIKKTLMYLEARA